MWAASGVAPPADLMRVLPRGWMAHEDHVETMWRSAARSLAGSPARRPGALVSRRRSLGGGAPSAPTAIWTRRRAAVTVFVLPTRPRPSLIVSPNGGQRDLARECRMG